MPRDTDVLPVAGATALNLAPIPVLTYSGDLSAALARGELTAAEALVIYEWMVVVRQFEQAVLDLRQGRFEPVPGLKYTGAAHLCIGQEAVAVGGISALQPQDYITSTHRGHGHSLAKTTFALYAMDEDGRRAFLGAAGAGLAGRPLLDAALEEHLYRTWAELLGKEDGYCRGRGGSMHIAEFHTGNLGANAIVGGSSAIAAGAALAAAKQGEDRVVLCFLGDGAMNNGVTLESLNFAAQAQFAHGVPVIYLIENNQYSQSGQTVGEITGLRFLAQRGAGFAKNNMHAEVVDGMDPLAVRDAVARARARCRAGDGPVLLECLTYRYVGHSASDDGLRYRTAEEVAAWREKDPLPRFRAGLLAAGVADEAALDKLEAAVAERLTRTLQRAALAADPDPAALTDDVYAPSPPAPPVPPAQWRTTDYDESRLRRFSRTADGEMLYRQAVLEAMTQEMLLDRRVVQFGEEIADYGGAFQVTYGLLNVFGRDRIWNAPISEAALIGAGVGMAMAGLRPIVEIMYIDFILQALDQLGNQAAKNRYMFGGKAKIPLVVRTTIGGGRGYAGQHSQSLEAALTQFPGLKVAAPATAADAKGLLKTAIRDDNPVVFIEHQLLYPLRGVVPEGEYVIPFGQGVVRREGTDVTLIAYSYPLTVALAAAELLAADGISAEVVDPRTLHPLDEELLVASARKTGRVVVVTQAPAKGSFAEHMSVVVYRGAFDRLKAPVEIVSTYPVPPPASPALEAVNMPSPERVAAAARRLVHGADTGGLSPARGADPGARGADVAGHGPIQGADPGPRGA